MRQISPSIKAHSPTAQQLLPMFSGAHLDLLVNHAPIFGSLFALALLIASYFTSADVLRRTAFIVLVGTAIAGAAADLSGDAAEEAVHGLPGVRRELIQAHSHMGDKAYILAIVLGVLALIALAAAPGSGRCYTRGGFGDGFRRGRFRLHRITRRPDPSHRSAPGSNRRRRNDRRATAPTPSTPNREVICGRGLAA